MYTHEIAAYLRVLIDDPNRVFFPDTTVALFLQQAESEYRNLLGEESFAVTYQPAALAGVMTLNLDNLLFGTTPTQPRCQRILRVIRVNGSGDMDLYLDPATSFETLAPFSNSLDSNVRWFLDRRTLRFSAKMTGTIQITYVPDSATTWTATTVNPPVAPALAVYVDDFGQFHDVIALLAAQQYYVKNAMGNDRVDAMLARRLDAIGNFAVKGRSGDGHRFVLDEGWG